MSAIERRHFLMMPALGAAAATVQAAPAGGKVGTAVIGTGNRGSYVLKGAMEHPSSRIVALCDLKPDRLDNAASIAVRDKPVTEKDYRKVLERKDVEAVIIATPPYLHPEMAIAALQAGKHVYCEKPVGITPEGVREVVKAVRSSKTVFTVGQQLRSMKQFQAAAAKIHGGEIGNVVMLKAQRHAPADLPHDGSSSDWFYDVSKSGGYLIEQSVHNLDLCNWVAGEHPISATGFGGTQLYKNDPPGRNTMDAYSLTFEYGSGLKLSFTQIVFHPKAMPGAGQYINVYGSKASVDFFNPALAYPFSGSPESVEFAPKQQEAPHAHMAAFYDAIIDHKPNPADITLGANAALTAILGHRAMTSGGIAHWSELGVEL